MALLYGMEHTNHDSDDPKFLGKNIFTNAFPLSLANYIDREKGLPIPVVSATVTDDGAITTQHTDTAWEDIIGTDPKTARWNFETTYTEYAKYTNVTPNGSDVVVRDTNGEDTSAFEIKLVVVPTSGSARKPREKQWCELVIRPASIEQLAFSIARSYGIEQRDTLRQIIVDALGTPQDLNWSSATAMMENKNAVIEAAENIIRNGIEEQTPLVVIAEWRTEGQTPRLDENAFDVFVVTDMALLSVFTETAMTKTKKVSRPYRSVIWLVKSLYDYSVQHSLQFVDITTKLNFGLQSDKSASFTRRATEMLDSDNFQRPRVKRTEVENILPPEAFKVLAPERRLDSALMTHYIINRQLEQAEAEVEKAVKQGDDPADVDLTD